MTEGAGHDVTAVRKRVWAGAPDACVDPVADVRRMRQEDIAISDEAAARRSASGSSIPDDSGAALLAQLGL